MLGLMRPPMERLAYCVRDCINGWGTDDTGLITLLVHLSERKRRDLVDKYKEIKAGGDLYDKIRGDTSGNYQKALLALVKPPPLVWAEAIKTAMKGLGTSDNLLINWMCIGKERMDEVRDHFAAITDGQDLAQWINGDCSGDYKDTLIRLANRRCDRFSGQEVGLSIAPPASKEDSAIKFTKCFNRLCRERKKSGENLIPKEEDQQEMGSAFLYYGQQSSCAPNMDIPGVWNLTNLVGFPPGDDGPDLVATFHEWDVSGTGEITWNDFVREMTTRINDPNHYEADPLPETIDKFGETEKPLSDGYKSIVFDASDDMYQFSEPEEEAGCGNNSGDIDWKKAMLDGSWKDKLKDIEPEEEDGKLAGPWGICVEASVQIEGEGWEGKFDDAPVGLIIDYLGSLGHDGFIGAAEAKEESCK